MSWHSFRPYVPVANRRRKAEASAKKLSKASRSLSPVQLEGSKIASTFWGKSWCSNLEAYSDYANRLPRGRTYVRNGCVIDLQVNSGKIEALVQGSDLYRVSITISGLCKDRWHRFKESCAGKVANLFDLLQGRLSKEILTDISARGTGLFPSPKEISLRCSCPDWADMCKHVAAVLYGVGARLDSKPEMFFTLRGVDMEDLIRTASSAASASNKGISTADAALSGANLSEVFGVDIELDPVLQTTAPTPGVTTPAKSARRTPRTKKSVAASPKKTRKKPVARTTARAKKSVKKLSRAR